MINKVTLSLKDFINYFKLINAIKLYQTHGLIICFSQSNEKISLIFGNSLHTYFVQERFLQEISECN